MATAEYPTAFTVEDFTTNLGRVHQRIDVARRRSPFDQPVRLLPVSKTVPADRLALAIEAGCTSLGENKAQEAYRKWQALGSTGVAWSVIGHLQTNKAKLVAECSSEFQALDSLRLAEA
ncbi:MAG: YggS family pyridoxal phosphate-dependent enzyme, partial [Aquihabitans sp.]